MRDQWREFPRELSSIDDVPPVLREALGSQLPAVPGLIHLFLIPQPRSFWDWFRDNPPRNTLFALTKDQRLILAKELSDGVDTSTCAVDDVICMEVGTILLNSWITLTHFSSQGTTDVHLEYGTVFERTFRSAVLWIRATNDPDPQLPPRHLWRMPGEEHIKALPLKFNNAARNYWLDGETALDACFVPAINLPRRLLTRFGGLHSNATALVLSDHELLIIKEQGSNGPGRWGQAWYFCPLQKIQSAEIVDCEPFPTVRVVLGKGRRIGPGCAQEVSSEVSVPFTIEQRAELERLLSRVRDLCAGRPAPDWARKEVATP